LIGSYDIIVGFGQRWALVVWQRIIFPAAVRCGSTMSISRAIAASKPELSPVAIAARAAPIFMPYFNTVQ